MARTGKRPFIRLMTERATSNPDVKQGARIGLSMSPVDWPQYFNILLLRLPDLSTYTHISLRVSKRQRGVFLIGSAVSYLEFVEMPGGLRHYPRISTCLILSRKS